MDLLYGDSDDEHDNVLQQAYSGRNGYVFLIDGRESMFQQPDKSYLLLSFETCLEAMLQIAREQRYDLVSFVLFGTSKSEGKFAPEHVVLLETLQTPSTDYIFRLKRIIADSCKQIIQNYGQVPNVSLAKAISYCKSLLHHSRTKLYNKSIVLFTNDDDPCINNVDVAHAARKRVEELCQHNIDLDVVGFGNFDSSKFFKELVLTSKGELLKDWIGKDPVRKIEDVQKEIDCISKKFNRHYGTFYLGEDAKMKVLIYKLYHEPQKLIWSSKDKVLEVDESSKEDVSVKKEVSNMIQEDEDIFQSNPDEVNLGNVNTRPKKYPMIAGRHIPMTKAELKWFEAKVEKGLTLIGFRKKSSIPVHLVDGEACFIIPDIREKGSAELFSLLHMSCLEKNVVALCWFALTKTASPILMMLFPAVPAEFAKRKKHPSGFHAIKIPFSDTINDCSEASGFPGIEASERQKEAAASIIKKTTINWTPDTFCDVEYKTRILMIEAIAMDYSTLPDVMDDTDIDLSDLAARLGELNEEFIDCSHLPPETVGKRTAFRDNGEESSTKGAKTYDLASLITKIKSGRAEQLTVAQLKEVLLGEGIKSLSTMNKPKLISIAKSRFCPD